MAVKKETVNQIIEAAEDKKDTFIKRIFRKRGTKE